MSEAEYIDYQLEQFGKKVRALRKEKGFTSAEKFAHQHKISRVQ